MSAGSEHMAEGNAPEAVAEKIPATLTKTAFARRQGWSGSYVTKLKDHGRLVLDSAGHVCVAESLARIAETRGGRGDVEARHARARAAEPAPPPARTPGEGESRADAISRKEAANADIAEMERDKMRGNLIPREEVEAAMRFIGATVFSLLDSFPGQNAAVLAPVSEVDEVEAQLVEACRNVQASLGDAIARQRAQIFEKGRG